MRTADVARIIVFLLAGSLFAGDCSWRFYPQNTNKASGIHFYFLNAPETTADVTISGTREGKPFTVSKTIETHPETDGGFLRFDTGNLDEFKVEKITIGMGGKALVYEGPKAGTQYRF